MSAPTIRQLHAQWAARVLPKDCSQAQRQETERAFFSGAAALFGLVVNEVAAQPNAVAERQMTDLMNELKDYFKLLGTIPGPHGTSRQ